MIATSPTITKLMGAMLAVQGEIDGVKKDAHNPHFKKPYASLESVVDTVRPSCQTHGLVVMQAPGAMRDGGIIALETMIVHAASGEWIKSEIELPLVKNDPQGAGSAITYGERYALMALFNLPPVDDDGTHASARPEPPPPQREATKVASDTNVTSGVQPPTADERAATSLILQLSSCKTENEFLDVKGSEAFRKGRMALGEEQRKRLDDTGKRLAARFAPVNPIAGG